MPQNPCFEVYDLHNESSIRSNKQHPSQVTMIAFGESIISAIESFYRQRSLDMK